MMNRISSFFWYDLETFGLNPFYDRIAQFAGQRTDAELNPIGEPVILYCRLSADYVPDPMACMVTGITPQEVKEKGIPESEFIEKINGLFSVPGTCVCGFNTMKFDDEFIRNALYRNFLDPYEREWKNGCSRWDIIDLVRAAHDLRPEGITWPQHKENGNPVFKLTELTSANKIDQTGAHDAMVDVNATIAVARLMKKKQPRLFEHYLKLRTKIEVKNLLDIQNHQPVLYTCAAFTNPNGCTSLVIPITPITGQDNTILCFNLMCDPAPLLASDAQTIHQVHGLIRIAVNKSPFLAPVNTLSHEDFARLGIDENICRIHSEQIQENMTSLIIRARQGNATEFSNPDDVDFGIYDGFFSDSDKNLFSVVRSTPKEQRLSLNLKFHDSRCPQMLWRHVCRNYPEVLDEENSAKWKQFAAARILNPPCDAINDIFFVERKIAEKLNENLTDREKSTLTLLSRYINSLKRYLGLT